MWQRLPGDPHVNDPKRLLPTIDSGFVGGSIGLRLGGR
jgi:hypothetical protein